MLFMLIFLVIQPEMYIQTSLMPGLPTILAPEVICRLTLLVLGKKLIKK